MPPLCRGRNKNTALSGPAPEYGVLAQSVEHAEDRKTLV